MGLLTLTRYGRREVCLATVLLGIVAAAVVWLGAVVSWWLLIAAALPAAVWLWVVWFFRDPDRKSPAGEGLLVSPADGVVSDVTPVGAESELGRDGVRIGIFMSIFDVHVNRSPDAVRVERVDHQAGAFLDARNPLATERNESTTIRMTYRLGGVDYPLVVRQIAGLIARRIVTDVVEGQSLCRGERIGMVKFGSRVELLVPAELAGEVCVGVGRHVQGGRTVLVAAGSGDAS